MQLQNFLTTVLAQKNKQVLWLCRKGSRTSAWNENYENIDDLVNAIRVHDKNPELTVYMALGSFADNIGKHEKTGRAYVQRKAYQATHFKTLACDLDVDQNNKNKYASQAEALQDLVRFCKAVSFPVPTIVLSGGGLHCYWPLLETISTAMWVRLSSALGNAFTTQNIKYDRSKIQDPTMVLRPIETHHKKDPSSWKLVRVLREYPALSAKHYAQKLSTFVTTARAPAKRVIEQRQDSMLAALQDGGTKATIEGIQQCAQLAALLASNGLTDAAGLAVSEPLWRASLGVAKYCEDATAAAIQLSSGYPGYDEHQCLEKLANYKGTGPTVCATFAALCVVGCATCQFKGRIASPAQLTAGVPTIQAQDPDTGASTKEQLPHGYTCKQNCIYYTHPRTGEEVFVSPYRLWVADRVTDMDRSANEAKIQVDYPLEGILNISVDSAIIAAGGNDLRKALANHQVYIKEDIEPMRRYLMTYLRKLQTMSVASNSYSHFGWQKDGTFLLGDRIIGAKEKVNVQLRGAAKEYVSTLTPKGDLAAWTGASAIFDLPGMEYHSFVVSLMLGAPLFAGQELAGVLVNMYSPKRNSGVGKTLTGMFGLAAWGNPKELTKHTKDSEGATYKHCGTLANMGAYIDELTTADDDTLRRIILTLQDGVEKGRLVSTADGFRQAEHWAMPIVTSSNKDIYDALGSAGAANAEQLRVLQLTFPKPDVFKVPNSALGRKVNRISLENYGHAGAILVADIIARGGPKAVYERGFDALLDATKFAFKGEERFYAAVVAIAYCGGILAKQLGLIKYDPMHGVNAALREILVIRKEQAANQLDAVDKLGQFLNENQNRIVHYREFPTGPRIIEPTPSNAIARSEVWVDQQDRPLAGKLYVSQAEFRYWLKRRGMELRDTMNELTAMGLRIQHGSRKVLYKGVPGGSAAGQVYCFEIDMMSHPRLIEAADGCYVAKNDGRKRLEVVSNG